MTGLDLLLAVAGSAVTIMVVVGMILITPRGQVEVRPEADAASYTAPTAEAPVRFAAERFPAEPPRSPLQAQEPAVGSVERHAHQETRAPL